MSAGIRRLPPSKEPKVMLTVRVVVRERNAVNECAAAARLSANAWLLSLIRRELVEVELGAVRPASVPCEIP